MSSSTELFEHRLREGVEFLHLLNSRRDAA